MSTSDAAPALPALEPPRSFVSATQAASMGDETHLAAILDREPKELGRKDELACDALCWAARNSRSATVSLLLSRDADVESKSYFGLRPLHHACQAYNDDVIKELLAKKADPNAPDEAGNTPFHFSCRRGVLSLCQLLVDAKADVNAKNSAGMTPLHVAAVSGQASIVQYLLAKGADVNEPDKAGETPVFFAAKCGFKAVVQVSGRTQRRGSPLLLCF
jgi:ankyrin repeat protein